MRRLPLTARALTFAIALPMLACGCNSSVDSRLPDTSPFLAGVPGRIAATGDGQAPGRRPEDLRHITILATNDIHGAVEPSVSPSGVRGGMSFWAGVVSSIREGFTRKHGDKGAVLVLDAGDQFQGTLLSNYTEGDLMFTVMDETGYDAAIPGNHDYDFGPAGWLDDKVTPTNPDTNPRGVIEKLASQVHFPLISANTFLKASLVDTEGEPVEVNGVGCRAKKPGSPAIDWSRARSPSFLKPYVVKIAAGVRIALIGIDNAGTPTTTTAENVSDLCFRDEYESYLDARRALEGKADIFIMVIHNGDVGKEQRDMSDLVRRLDQVTEFRAVDAVVAGHTHQLNQEMIDGHVPAIQSNSSGTRFGRIDLVWNATTETLVADSTRGRAGLELKHDACDRNAADFCTIDETGRPVYEGVPVTENPRISARVSEMRTKLDIMAKRKLGVAKKPLTRDRIDESPLADALTDAMRATTGTEISFMNNGGLRTDIPAGPVTYETLFEVIPFSNRALKIGPMRTDTLLSLILRSARSCGGYGSLMQSGLRVSFHRDCTSPVNGADPNAKLERVETIGGEVVYDATLTQPTPTPERVFIVSTLDFLSAGGSGYTDFVGIPVLSDFGILREALVEEFIKHPTEWSGEMDGRWKKL